ncbi:MAG: MotA/TolQ/ExbB proton channel family protein [Chthoniobacterales bacterium]
MATLLICSALKTVANFFIQGGVFMFVLVALSIVTVAVTFLRGKVIQYKKVIPPEIEAEVERLTPDDSLDPLLRLAKQYPSPLSNLIVTVIQHRDLGWEKEETVEAVQTKARNEVVKLEKGVLILEISTGIAPLLGLLGTLSGLVGVFMNLGPSGDPVGVALGIAEALNATIAGLVIAVVSLIAFNYFSRKVEILAVSMESITSDLIAKCYPRLRQNGLTSK